ncbi:MAG: hypothetical protein A3C88_01715 [Candidatus Yanofskybacteria bacterium RIFCSPHIGHO2_02_FULL_50_12]|uniref:Prepilin-type N-terminal cleavage/methylation domain-containing protein n=1 Tax=Candidatus Yanofskybacteria bacterium RIFCSPHIGHO2_02_FULL_50_12 TaxID=1802685 RepID=A0A1F8FVI1_9BACT|nr:MAG: hypothetical protein A3C88_01715 [Candidatus Yanofskybacteria bacterium RIFCSPHIGHO2_02_FULL_50_12]
MIISKERGFTLVEVLVSSFVFSIIVLGVSGLFVQVIGNQRRAVAAQEIQENGLFILELMSREIRVSQIVDSDQIPAGDSSNCTLTRLAIRHPVNGTVIYSIGNGLLLRTASGTTTELSSSAISFSRLNFCLLGSGPTDQQQTRVTILAASQNKTGKEILTVNLQTTVSSRDVQTEI